MELVGLVDCNNFFASCERVFDPSLWDKPVAVLSNNDGCVVARSNEVKAMGVPMGAPYFKYKELLLKNKVKIFSSNFAVYGDMSARVMQTISYFCPELEIYSVDEAFVNVGGYQDVDKFSRQVRRSVFRNTGIPTSVGVGPTKTLAKAASEITKKHPEYKGVLVLDSKKLIDYHLRNMPVGDLWGVGRGYSERFKKLGMQTAYEFKEADDSWVKRNFGSPGLGLVTELRGIKCEREKDLDFIPKSIIRSRSFGRKIKDKKDLREAIAFHASDAARKLRSQNLTAGYIQPFITTGRHSKGGVYMKSLGANITPTNDTFDLTNAAVKLLDKIYKPGFFYNKAGVTCLDIKTEQGTVQTLFDSVNKQKKPVLQAMDRLNEIYGKNTIALGSLGVSRWWRGRKDLSSKHYTTSWSELPVAKA